MDYSFLERLKSKVLAGAQTSAVKIEEAARAGKLHLDVMAERRKLMRAYTELGKEAHAALTEGTSATLAQRAGVADLQAEIERRKREIVDLDARLAQSKKPR